MPEAQRYNPESERTMVIASDVMVDSVTKHLLRFPQDLSQVIVPQLVANDIYHKESKFKIPDGTDVDLIISDEQTNRIKRIMDAAHAKYGGPQNMNSNTGRRIVHQFISEAFHVLSAQRDNVFIRQFAQQTDMSIDDAIGRVLSMVSKCVQRLDIKAEAKKYREEAADISRNHQQFFDEQTRFQDMFQERICDSFMSDVQSEYPFITFDKAFYYDYINNFAD